MSLAVLLGEDNQTATADMATAVASEVVRRMVMGLNPTIKAARW